MRPLWPPPYISDESEFWWHRDETWLLPYHLKVAGYHLLQWERDVADPYVLYDPDGLPVAEWPWEPSLGELLSYVGSKV